MPRASDRGSKVPKRQGNEREAQTLYVCFGAMRDLVPSRNAGNKEQRRC